MDVLRSVLLQKLIDSFGPDVVSIDANELAFFAEDIFSRGALPIAIVKPRNITQAKVLITTITAACVPVVPRGGGLSYTGGYLPQVPAILIDLDLLNAIVEINVEDRYVVVEAGAKWADLDAALAPHGLRTPFWGPLSGLRSTIGGALSQGAMFFGSGQHGSVADSVIGLEVICASGEHLITGSAAAANSTGFLRNFGPDLTGLFIGDCGALGVKLRATFRLIERPTSLGFVSYEYSEYGHMLAAMADVSRSSLASECFGFDPSLASIRLKPTSLKTDTKTLANVVRQSGLIAAAKLVFAGRTFLTARCYSAHVTVEADSAAMLAARMKRIRDLLAINGRETENSIPKATRAMPFPSPKSILGPDGERWVPVHGIFPHSKAKEAYDACESVFAENRAAIEANRVKIGVLVTTLSQQATLIEPMFFWWDSHTCYHKHMVEPGFRRNQTEPLENPDARALVIMLRLKVASAMRALGGAHFQLGRFYNYREGRNPGAIALFDAIKQKLDPHNLMNPGVLE